MANTTLPRRARQALERVLVDVRAEMGQQLPQLLQESELALARAAPSSDSKLESARLTSIRNLGRGVQAFSRRYLASIETSLANLQATRSAQGKPTDHPVLELQLLEDDVVSDETTLVNMASRMESRNSLALQLLGQRFGVLAGAPAFDGETLPLGPYALCNALANAADSLELSRYARLLLFQQFEKAMAEFYPPMLDALNARLAQDGILPYLSFVPVRVRPGSAAPAAAAAAAAAAVAAAEDRSHAGEHAGGHGGGSAPHQGADHAGSAAQSPPPSEAAEAANPGFAALQDLLHRRRALINKLRPGVQDERARAQLPHGEVLGALQHMRNTATKADSPVDFRQILLAQARQLHGHGVSLAEADNDSFELLNLFMNQLQRELRKSSPGETLVDRLRLPLVQLAMRDQSFFTNAEHPGRRLLDAVSLAGARWLADDDLDNQWLGLLQRAVASVQHDSDAGLDTFTDANQTLQAGLQALARKAEMAERRQVDAARGREKLEVARRRAQTEIARLTEGRNLPEFQTALLEQAWVDVLSLAHLRNGEHSDAWLQLLDVTTRIIDTCTAESAPPLGPTELECMRAALEQVGYHSENVDAIVHRLAAGSEAAEDPATDPDLLLQLGTQVRLGEGHAPANKAGAPLLSTDEQSAMELLRTLREPAWVEIENDQGHAQRYRLAWVSAHTGQILVVNRRGQRTGHDELETLARKLAEGQMRLLVGDTPPAEAAWDATITSLLRTAGEPDALPDGGNHGH